VVGSLPVPGSMSKLAHRICAESAKMGHRLHCAVLPKFPHRIFR